MHTLLALIFQNESGAQEMIYHVQTLQRQQLITISDAALIVHQKNEKIKVKQANSLVGAGALGGAFWGLLIGQHFWSPVITVGEKENAAIKGSDCGIDEDFLQKAGDAIQPGYSALFMIVAYMTKENLAVLTKYNATLLYTHLNAESDSKLREAFGIMEEL